MTKQHLNHNIKREGSKSTKSEQADNIQPDRIERFLHLQSLVGNQAVQRMLADGTLQRDSDNFQLTMPELGSSLANKHQLSLGGDSLKLDPDIQAKIEAIKRSHELLEPDFLGSKLFEIDPSMLGKPQPDFLKPLPEQDKKEQFPQGKGPDTPRAGEVGDVLKAIMGLPAVKEGLDKVKQDVSDKISRDWNSLSTGGKGAVITSGIVLGAGVVAGAIKDPSILSIIENKDIPIPKTPLSLKFNLSGDNQNIMIGLDVGQLLPKSLGFGKN